MVMSVEPYLPQTMIGLKTSAMLSWSAERQPWLRLVQKTPCDDHVTMDFELFYFVVVGSGGGDAGAGAGFIVVVVVCSLLFCCCHFCCRLFGFVVVFTICLLKICKLSRQYAFVKLQPVMTHSKDVMKTEREYEIIT